MTRALFITLAFFSPLLFPFPLAATLIVISATVSPLSALAGGMLIDAAYFSRGAAFFPVYALLGAALAVVGVFARRFLQARIMFP